MHMVFPKPVDMHAGKLALAHKTKVKYVMMNILEKLFFSHSLKKIHSMFGQII